MLSNKYDSSPTMISINGSSDLNHKQNTPHQSVQLVDELYLLVSVSINQPSVLLMQNRYGSSLHFCETALKGRVPV